jgi:hypothetical protein
MNNILFHRQSVPMRILNLKLHYPAMLTPNEDFASIALPNRLSFHSREEVFRRDYKKPAGRDPFFEEYNETI